MNDFNWELGCIPKTLSLIRAGQRWDKDRDRLVRTDWEGGPQWPCVLLEKPSAQPIELERTHVLSTSRTIVLWGVKISQFNYLSVCAPPHRLWRTHPWPEACRARARSKTKSDSSPSLSWAGFWHIPGTEKKFTPGHQGIRLGGFLKGTNSQNKTVPAVTFLHVILPIWHKASTYN